VPAVESKSTRFRCPNGRCLQPGVMIVERGGADVTTRLKMFDSVTFFGAVPS
jgi:hypothetical protein